MTSYLQTDDPLLTPPTPKKTSAHIHSVTSLDAVLNPREDGESSLPDISNLAMKQARPQPYIQHGAAVLPYYPHIITPLSPALANTSIGGNNNFGTGVGYAMVSQLPFAQAPQYPDKLINPATKNGSSGRNKKHSDATRTHHKHQVHKPKTSMSSRRYPRCRSHQPSPEVSHQQAKDMEWYLALREYRKELDKLSETIIERRKHTGTSTKTY